MNIADCYYLGYISKKHGTKGEVNAFLDVDNPLEYSKMESVFVELHNELIPFFIDHILVRTNLCIVQFSDTNASQAEELIGKKLYLPLSSLPPLTGNKFYFHEVIGFEVVDTQLGSIGQIEQVLDHRQPLLQISFQEKEILIPVVDEIILLVDREKKQVVVNTPEGLVDIYLQ